jgi:hypothetical protein
LIAKRSYRNTVVNKAGFILVLSAWVKITRQLFRCQSTSTSQLQGKDGYAIWDNRTDVAQLRYDNIVLNGGTAPQIFIARSGCGSSNNVQAFLWFVTFLLLLPWFLIWSLFARKPENVALLFAEFVEAHDLIRHVSEHAIKNVYFFCPYENDANALYLLLKKEGVIVNKIPSPNLLSIHNTEMLTDCITLTSPCQLDELSSFKATMQYDSIAYWLPEQFYTYSEIYKSKKVAPAKSIGYYSHGSWLRVKAGAADSLLGDTEAELELLKSFASFMHAHPAFHCTIFLHPKEKAVKDSGAVTQYYDSVFGAGRYSFADASKAGSVQFDTVDIGVGAISTILFERLFMGFKTIFFPAGMRIFPMKGSAIASICPVTSDSLEQLILQSSAVSTSEFLSQNNLMKYTVYNWKPELGYDQEN